MHILKHLGYPLTKPCHKYKPDELVTLLSDNLVYKAVASGMSFIASHTCLDKAEGGVNHCLADRVGVKNLKISSITLIISSMCSFCI